MKAVRGRRHFPRRLDCAWAGDREGREACSLTLSSVLRPPHGPPAPPPPGRHLAHQPCQVAALPSM